MRQRLGLAFGAFILAGLIFLAGSYSPVQSQVPIEAADPLSFHQQLYVAALGNAADMVDSEFMQTYMNTLMNEGYSTEQQLQALMTFGPWFAKQQADAALACYWDDEACDWNVRGVDWPMENPDDWYRRAMEEPEYVCSHWPDYMQMPVNVFWLCYGLDGGTAAGGIEINYGSLACWTLWETNRPAFRALGVTDQTNCFESMQ